MSEYGDYEEREPSVAELRALEADITRLLSEYAALENEYAILEERLAALEEDPWDDTDYWL